MKIRNGFVSNSSSSSFVILGVKYTGSDGIDIMKKHGLGCNSDGDVIGIDYFHISDDSDLKESEISLEEIQKDFDKLRVAFGEDAKIRWYYGMEFC